MQPAYRIFPIDLTVARAVPGERFVQPGEKITAVVVLDVPAGSSVAYRFGDNGDDIQFSEAPSWSICPPADEGLRVSNPVGAGTARLFVGFADTLTPT